MLRESSLWQVREVVGRRLRALREKRKLTVAELAELSGVNDFEIAFLERGRRSVRFESLLSLSHALGVPVPTFFE